MGSRGDEIRMKMKHMIKLSNTDMYCQGDKIKVAYEKEGSGMRWDMTLYLPMCIDNCDMVFF